MQFTFKNIPEEKRRFLRELEIFANANHLPPSVRQAADLALEEHLTNVINYAYADTRPHEIIVRLTVDPEFLRVEVEDDGRPFNPVDRPEVDTTRPLDEKPIGGLGIHLIRKFMDEFQYRREVGKNIFQMRKRMAGPSR